MRYIKLNEDKWIEYDESTDVSKVIIKSELEAQLAECQSQLDEIDLITDEQLLVWAKENYPYIKSVPDRDMLVDRINSITSILENLNA